MMYTICFEMKGQVGYVRNVMADALAMMEEIISRRAMILLVLEDQP